MKEPYIEGLASYDGPKSCTCSGNGAGEALTGVCVGEVLSREIMTSGCRRGSGLGRQHGLMRYRERQDDPAQSETLACVEISVRENREIPRTARYEWCVSGRTGKASAVAGDERAREVGQLHSTDEVAERSVEVECRAGPRRSLNGHEGGNAGYSQGRA